MRLALLLWLAWTTTGGATPAQDLNRGMADLADRLNKSLAAQGFKKMAAVDFTNLQEQPTELGRSLTERLTIEITSVVPVGVRMLDRANTRRILDELKLTQSGLVDPTNAKKLGEFSGADVLLIGSVTEHDTTLELMVKVIATATSEIVAAGRLEFPKSSESLAMHNRLILPNASPGSATPGAAGSGSASYAQSNAIATKDLGALRVVLKSLALIKNSGRATGLRCQLDFISRETQRPVVVAMNAEVSDIRSQADTFLRTSALDDAGGAWRLFASSVAGVGFVRAGVHGRDGRESYSATDIVKLLGLRDRLGRETDDPADGTSDGAGFVNAYGAPPKTFFPYIGNRFISGSTTTLGPGQVLPVTMDLVAATNGAAPRSFQISSEIVVGVTESSGKIAYSLKTLTFDKVNLPSVALVPIDPTKLLSPRSRPSTAY